MSETARIALRPVTEADTALLFEVYAGTRAEELSVLAWDDATKRGFLAQQFTAQDLHYREHYPHAAFDVIEIDGAPAGRLYVDRWDREIRIIDIALLPQFRGRGAGTRLLRDLVEEADVTGRALSIHVERNNPARSLYDRLGFEPVSEDGVYFKMERPPAGGQPKTAS